VFDKSIVVQEMMVEELLNQIESAIQTLCV
jgi:hypothetical protein